MAVFMTGGKAPKEYDENTLLLLHGDEVVDKSMRGCVITNTGVTISDGQTKLKNSSLYFDGSAKLAINLDDLGLDFNGDWTFEFYHYTTSETGNKSAFFCLNQTSGGFIIGSPSGGGTRIFAGDSWGFIPVSNIGSIVNDKWVHRAICKKGTTVYAFEDGALYGTITTSGALTPTATELLIGYRTTTNYTGGIYGYLDEIRISDIARWTAAFTPPTEPYKG